MMITADLVSEVMPSEMVQQPDYVLQSANEFRYKTLHHSQYVLKHKTDIYSIIKYTLAEGRGF